MNSEIIIQSLELAAAACEDPTAMVYQRLFDEHPGLQELFILDRQNEAKGHMLFEVIECIIDFVGPRYTSEGLITTELINHQQIGVPLEVFETFFATVRDTFRDFLGADWTAQYDEAWERLLEELSSVVHGNSHPPSNRTRQ